MIGSIFGESNPGMVVTAYNVTINVCGAIYLNGNNEVLTMSGVTVNSCS